MKHPVLDRLLMFVCALLLLCTAGFGAALLLDIVSVEAVAAKAMAFGELSLMMRVAVWAVVVVVALLAVLLVAAMLPARRKRSSTFAVQRNENGMVRISLKALETLVQKCLNQHAELRVVTSSLYSDEETIRVDVHISLQSDISMPLAISALQKQIKKYLEACSGVMVQEVRVFVDSTMPATEETAKSPYAIPDVLLGINGEAQQELSAAATQSEEAEEADSAEELVDAPQDAAQAEALEEAQAAQDEGETQA